MTCFTHLPLRFRLLTLLTWSTGLVHLTCLPTHFTAVGFAVECKLLVQRAFTSCDLNLLIDFAASPSALRRPLCRTLQFPRFAALFSRNDACAVNHAHAVITQRSPPCFACTYTTDCSGSLAFASLASCCLLLYREAAWLPWLRKRVFIFCKSSR